MLKKNNLIDKDDGEVSIWGYSSESYHSCKDIYKITANKDL